MISFCLIVRNAEDTLPACLTSIRPVADEICVVDTDSKDNTLSIAQAFGAKVQRITRRTHPDKFLDIPDEQGVLHESLADFAYARNLSFSMARPGNWIFWLDSDDTLEGLDHWSEMLDRFERDPGIDAVVMPYEYAYDAKGRVITLLWRERLLRWTPAWKWEGPIHEILPARQKHVATYEKVRVCHRKDRRQHPVLKRRNYTILKAKANDGSPRSLFYLGAEAAHCGEYKEATEAFQRFLTVSDNEEETYQALFMLGDLFRVNRQWEAAVAQFQKAMLIRPTWRDAYFGMAEAMVLCEDWDRAIFYAMLGRKQEVLPQTALAFNPLHEHIGWVPSLATAFHRKGDLPRARQAIEDGLAEDPENPAFLTMRADLETERLRLEEQSTFQSTVQRLIDKGKPHEALQVAEALGISGEPPLRPMRQMLQTADRMELPGRNPEFRTVYASQPDARFDWLARVIQSDPRRRRIAFPGAGSALFARALFYTYHMAVEAWDPNPLFVDKVRAIKETAQWGGSFQMRYARLLNPPTAPQDLIVLMDVLEYVTDPQAVVEEMQRWLVPGGSLLMIVPEQAGRGMLQALGPNDLRHLGMTHRLPERVGGAPGGAWYCLEVRKEDTRLIAPKTIGIVCAPALEVWGPHSLETGIGGSEECVIQVSRQLVRRGHEVTVYGDWVGEDVLPSCCPKRTVLYRPREAYEPCDVVVGWRSPELFMGRRPLEAEWRWLWMHDVADPKRVAAVVDRLDAILVGSVFQANLFPEAQSLCKVIRYGLDPEEFAPRYAYRDGKGNDLWAKGEGLRDPHKFIWTSCPTRGLEELLDAWPAIRKEVRDASLHVFYGFTNFDRFNALQPEAATPERLALKARILTKAKQPGVVWRDRVGQRKIAEEMLSSGVWAYPTSFPEIACLSAAKSCAAGCWPVFYPTAAMPETVAWGWQSRPETFAQDCIAAAAGEKSEAERQRMMAWGRQSYSWEKVALAWERVMRGA